MNKKLVAAALGLAFAAPVFADASNVTLYGRVHQAIVNQSVDNAAGGSTGSNAALENYASRLGVRGVEDLGGGLAVIFAYELGFNTDASATTSGLGSARHSYLGFKDSKWGTFVAGTQDGGNDSQAPLYNQAQTFLGTPNNNAGDIATVGGSNVLGSFNGGLSASNAAAISRQQRTENSFGYAANIAGVAVSFRHALGGTNDAQTQATTTVATPSGAITARENDFRQTEVAANYKIGALEVGAGYLNVDRSTGGQAAALLVNPTVPAVKSTFQVGAKYTYGDLTVGGLVGQVKLEQATAAGRDDKNTQFGLHGDYKIGKGGIYGLYAKSEREDLAANAEVSQVQVAYYYDLSKRTRAYTAFNRSTREIGIAGGRDLDQDTFVAGLRHNF